MHDSVHTRSSMSMIECEDATLLSLSHDIDRHTSQLRNDVLHSIAAIRTKLHQQTAEAMEHQQLLAQATEQRLLQHIEQLQSLLEVRTSELAREKQLTEKLIGAQFAQKRRQRQREAATEALRAWHRLVAREKEVNLIAEKAVKDRQEREARSAFATWRLQSLKLKYEKSLEKTIGDHHRAVAKATHERQAFENASKIEILALKEKVNQEEDRRAVLEEKLKAAFMRGVCALNLEAMQVLRNTSEAGMHETSVASLVQQINISGLEPTEPSLHLAEGSEHGNDAATLARLLQRQQALAAQMGALQSAALAPTQASILHPEQQTRGSSATHVVPGQQTAQRQGAAQQGANSGPLLSSNGGRVVASTSSTSVTSHQAFTVSVNPSYSTSASVGGATGRGRGSASSRPSTALPRVTRK